MKVVILQGSPRREGNTETVCGEMAEGMRAAGAEVETLRIADMKVGGCTACYACQTSADVPGCPLKDEMPTIYDKVLSADAVVLASPVYCWGFTAQLKAALDRFYAFCKFSVEEAGKFRCLVEGKRAALVMTAGGGPYDGAELCVAAFRAMAEFMRMDWRGELVAAPVGEPAATAKDKALMARAEDFGRKFVK